MSAISPHADSSRAYKLTKFFNSVTRGDRTLTTTQEGKLFIDSICSQEDHPTCVEKLTSGPAGLGSVQACIRFDVSPTFINDSTTRLLQYLASPTLEAIHGGSLLQQVIKHLVEPPLFWTAFLQSFREAQLDLQAQESFAWLLLELLNLPNGDNGTFIDIARGTSIQNALLNSSNLKIRTKGQKIKKFMLNLDTPDENQGTLGAGGRHDNDFSDFRQISILPTADELLSKEPPFLCLAGAIEAPNVDGRRSAIHLDGQFRLLREDMLSEMREEIHIILGNTKGYHKGLVLNGLSVKGIDCGTPTKRLDWGLQLQCKTGIRQLAGVKPKERKKYLLDHRDILAHQSLACLIIDGEIVAFPSVHRDIDMLAQDPPTLTLNLKGKRATTQTLLKLKTSQKIQLVQIKTGVFSFEPILRQLQRTVILPLEDQLLNWAPTSNIAECASPPTKFIDKIVANPSQDLKSVLNAPKSIVLDTSQAASLLSGLKQRVSLIQGPPGTGKSFIGALIAKSLVQFTKKTLLVVCYKNHALDQFLEDLLDIGIPSEYIVRLGSKSTERTKPLTMFEQSARSGPVNWTLVNNLKSSAAVLADRLGSAFNTYNSTNLSKRSLLEFLEFSAEGAVFYEAFEVPYAQDGMTTIGTRGKAVNEFYLLDRWSSGADAGMFKSQMKPTSSRVWKIPRPERAAIISNWRCELLRDQAVELAHMMEEYNETSEKLSRAFRAKNEGIIKSKRIVACTTTAAAMYTEDLQAATRDVVLVEEAGEILESHILTALGPKTQQLILIGDHKQLRPKINDHRFSVESGEGYDLNRSLFERLILKKFPHRTLLKQHRMRPEISSLIRLMTYPLLEDAASTKGRPNLCGFQDNIIFLNHGHAEEGAQLRLKREDFGADTSKRNEFEANLVVKCVRYLAQQGYGTENVVVLTAYLAQVSLLRDKLSETHDPILNDLDSFDLVRAGLMPTATAKFGKRSIRLSTIDNYQGEEKDIVIASLTRNNPSRDIGWLAQSERLNVLLSRARNALILIGNAETFVNARKGKAMWNQLFDELKKGGHIYDGFPVQCERHPERKALLKTPEDFDSETPDGGCKEPCETMLNCGLHSCPQRCHQLQDHSKMPCEYVLQEKCSKGHVYLWKCHNSRPKSCPKCERDAKEAEKQKRRELERQRKRDLELEEHNKKIAKMDETIEKEAQARKDAEEAQARANALKQKQKDVENALARSHSVVNNWEHRETGSSQTVKPQSAPTVPQPEPGAGAGPEAKSSMPPTVPVQSPMAQGKQDGSMPHVPRKMNTSLLSPSRQEWQRQKDLEGAKNEFIDSIMDMIGLEDVKVQILRIKAKIDVNRRQKTDCKDERFNISLLGNPGTGKTTIARFYAKFLTSLDVLPGLGFLETTGSLIAHEGIAGAKKMIDSLHNAGGGAFFIDEAYQLTSGHNFGGGPVLDYLLAEMENNIGKIVFIVAGYNREMEKFFEHNPGLTSRVPYSLQFNDYTDEELLCILQRIIRKKYQGKMIIEDDDDGLFMRIVVRRLGRGRDRPGFGNARAMQTVFAKICERQAERLNRERKHGLLPNDFFMSKEDLIGPDPSVAVMKSKAWEHLQELTGLNSVKASVQTMIDRIETNYKRELEEKLPIEVSLNRCFMGAPGTGKTSVAKLYGQVMVDVGLLSNGEVIVKNPSDFIGSHLGESEKNTKAILASTKGKVLVIDEAYMLYEGKDGVGNRSDSFRTAVVDTLVAEIQSVPGEDRCVLLLGYEEQIRTMFENVNPGLSRRFAIEASFLFEDFTLDQLMEILESKMRHQDLGATDGARLVARDVLERASRRPNFGNAGEVENQLGHAKNRFQARQSAKKPSDRAHNVVFEPQDFDPDFDRVSKAASRMTELFKDIVGCQEVVTKLSGYQQIAHSMKSRGLDPSEMIPTNFLFKGPPGTGKTTTARNMGQVFYDMGILSDIEVIDCAASDLIGQYVGHTSPKTVAQLDKALGKVLFIDEAYRLAEGHFAAEALNELVDQLTKPKYKGKLVVILAGYEKDINRLVSSNPGLSSRFSEEVMFYEMTTDECLNLLERDLKRQNIDTPPLSDPNEPQQLRLISLFRQLSSIPSWGNARDVKTLARNLAGTAFKSSTNVTDRLTLSFDEIIDHAKAMLAERQIRSANLPSNPRSGAPKGFTLDLGAQPQARSASKPGSNPSASSKPGNDSTPQDPAKTTSDPATQPQDPRDDGVTDEVWDQLQQDKQAEARRSQLYDATDRNQENQLRLAKAQEAEKEAEARKLAEAKAEDDAAKAELRRRQDIARRREREARIAREQAQRELERIRAEEARRKKLEAEKQAKLRNMGVCVAGFRWIKQSGGYRCAGGSHFVSDAALGL